MSVLHTLPHLQEAASPCGLWDSAVAMVSLLSFLHLVPLGHQNSPLPHPLLPALSGPLEGPEAGGWHLCFSPSRVHSLGFRIADQVKVTLGGAKLNLHPSSRPGGSSRPLVFLWVPSDLQQALATEGCSKVLAGKWACVRDTEAHRQAVREPGIMHRISPPKKGMDSQPHAGLTSWRREEISSLNKSRA